MKKIKTEINTTSEEKSTGVRPTNLSEYIGQENIRKNLQISISAAKVRNKSLDHFLFSGPPGLGKTSLAMIVAAEMKSKIRVIGAPVIEKPKDIAAILASLEEGEILFIDEIHRLPKSAEEMLYSAMEDRKIEIIIGEAEQAKIITMPLESFTLIGATTREGLLSKPLLDRFQNKYHFSYYTEDELGKISKEASVKYGTPVSNECALIIGKASRGTPRVAVNITKQVSDYMLAADEQSITPEKLLDILKIIGIAPNGYTQKEIQYLDMLNDFYNSTNKPVGLKTISAFMGESEDTIQDVIEPYLLQTKMIARTSSGRIPLSRKGKNAPGNG